MFKINVKRWVALVGLIALTSVLLGNLFAGTALAQGPTPQTPGPGYMGADWGHHGGQPGMMGDQGYNGWGYNRSTTPAVPSAVPYGNSWQPGMMGGEWHDGWGYGFTPAPVSTGTTPYYGGGWDGCW